MHQIGDIFCCCWSIPLKRIISFLSFFHLSLMYCFFASISVHPFCLEGPWLIVHRARGKHSLLMCFIYTCINIYIAFFFRFLSLFTVYMLNRSFGSSLSALSIITSVYAIVSLLRILQIYSCTICVPYDGALRARYYHLSSVWYVCIWLSHLI